MSAQASLTPERNMNLYYRKGADFSKVFTFVDADGDDFSLSSYTFTVNIKRREDDTLNVYQLTSGSGLTKGSNTLTITLTDTQSATLNGDYYWELKRTDGSGLIKWWLKGGFLQVSQDFDGVTETTQITITV